MTILVENESSTTNDSSKKLSNNSTESMELFITSHSWWLGWLLKGNANPWNDNQTNVATGRKVAMMTDASHRLDLKSMMEVQFTLVQPWITIFTSLFHYGCMSVGIRELLGC